MKTVKKKLIGLLTQLGLILLSLIAIRYLLFPLLGNIIEKSSPWYKEKVAIAERNQVEDAFSGVLGSTVDAIPKDSISGWFSSKEYKEIDFFVPKLVNTSALFRDTQYRDVLKDTLIDAINTDTVEDQTATFKLFYNGATIATWENGRQLSTFRTIPPEVRKEVEEHLKKTLATDKAITFQQWDFLLGKENIDFIYDASEETVRLDGVFLASKGLLSSERYHVTASYQKQDGKWQLVPNSLEVSSYDK